jgi:predicted RNA-binding protein associated with RNAse of E/G family
MMRTVRVEKLSLGGEVTVAYEGVVLRRTPTSMTLEANFTRETMALGYVTFTPGDRMVEHFYSDRMYNVFAIYNAGDDVFKGWYCNITRPAEIAARDDGPGWVVRAVDLALDYFRQPGGAEFVLDEDEFAALPLDAAEAAAARSALADLRALAARGEGPFRLAD